MVVGYMHVSHSIRALADTKLVASIDVVTHFVQQGGYVAVVSIEVISKVAGEITGSGYEKLTNYGKWKTLSRYKLPAE